MLATAAATPLLQHLKYVTKLYQMQYKYTVKTTETGKISTQISEQLMYTGFNSILWVYSITCVL